MIKVVPSMVLRSEVAHHRLSLLSCGSKRNREVALNLVYREFTRIGLEKVPDAKALARIAQALGAEIIERIHERLVEIAQERGVVKGRKMRVDTTVVETNIHYPTESSLLGDGARVVTLTLKKMESKAGKLKRKLRDRTRSVNKRVRAIANSSRSHGEAGGETQAAISRSAAVDPADSERQQTRAERDSVTPKTGFTLAS